MLTIGYLFRWFSTLPQRDRTDRQHGPRCAQAGIARQNGKLPTTVINGSCCHITDRPISEVTNDRGAFFCGKNNVA